MPLTANFLADFSSFLTACKDSIAATASFTQAAAGVGPAVDASLKQAAGGFAETDASLQKQADAAYANGVKIGNALKTVAREATTFASGYIQEFAEAEQATIRLGVALKGAGETSPAVAQQYAALATQLQSISRWSDEAITDVEELFTRVAGIKPDDMEATLRATMDLAAGMKIDLYQAAKLVATAAESNGTALGKLKIALGDNLKPGADFAEVMDAINKQFGGANLADLNSTAGSMENLKNQMSDVNELVGEVLAENLKKILNLFQSMPEWLQTFSIAVVGIGTALAPVLVSLASLVSLLSTTGIGAGIASFFTWLLPYLGLAGWIALGVIGVVAAWKNWDAIAGFVSSVYNAVKTWMVDKLTALIDYIVTLPGRVTKAFYDMAASVALFSYVPDMVSVIQDEFGRLDRVMVAPARDAVADVMGDFQRMTDAALAAPTLTAGARGAAGGASGPINVSINMTGMMGTDDPQTRAMIRDVVSDALMQGMRGTRLMGTA